MFHRKSVQTAIVLFLVALTSCSTPETGKSPSEMALANKESILSGWNTWDNRSILHHILLPEEIGLMMRLKEGNEGEVLGLAFTGNRVPGTEKVMPIAHTPDGSFTDFTLEWRNIQLRVQSVSQGKDLQIRVTRLNPEDYNNDLLLVRNEFIYNNRGEVGLTGETIVSTYNDVDYTTSFLAGEIKRYDDQNLAVPLNKTVYVMVGSQRSKEEIDLDIRKASDAWNSKKASYGDFAESFNAIQNAVNWTVVYDHVNQEPVIPVARPWSYGWGEGQPGGWIRFCWDNFFVAYMQAITSKELAFSEAIEMCNYVDEFGMVPNFIGPFNLASRDRSQPPVGSMMVREIYKLHPEKWFLEKTFDQLLTWNRWWPENRDQEGYLAWGSNPAPSPNNDKRELVQNVFKAASNESGLDNTPMYDGVTYDTSLHMLKIGDVGLMGLFVGDCEALADIAAVIGRTAEEAELRERAETYRAKIRTMWDEKFGLFLNYRTDLQEPSYRISPTNFYALIAEAATQEQAERMMKEHFYNPEEFWGEYIMPSAARNDTAYTGQDYWRGSIWAPMNFLVYYGMRNYELPQAQKDLSEKSKNLLMKEWLNRGYIRENYHAETGGAPTHRSEHFYHWGALLGMINMIEEGFVPGTEVEIDPSDL